MKKTLFKLLSVSALVTFAAPTLANEFSHVWSCELKAGKTIDDARAVSLAWLHAAKSMKGGDQLQVHINYPIVVGPSGDRFEFVLVAPSLEAWGVFYDGYAADSPAANADEDFAQVATCPGSALWEFIKIE